MELNTDTDSSSDWSSFVAPVMDWSEAHPELTNCIVTALLWSLGDVLAQVFERHVHSRKTHLPLPQSPSRHSMQYGPAAWRFSFARTLRLASFAGLLFAPVTKAWFEFLEAFFPGSGWIVAVQRMLLDQSLYSSCVIVSLMVWIGLLESRFSIAHTRAKVRANYWPAITSNWLLWPAVQIGLQGVVPLQYRMLVAALVNVPWTAYLAWRTAGHGPVPSEVELTTR